MVEARNEAQNEACIEAERRVVEARIEMERLLAAEKERHAAELRRLDAEWRS